MKTSGGHLLPVGLVVVLAAMVAAGRLTHTSWSGTERADTLRVSSGAAPESIPRRMTDVGDPSATLDLARIGWYATPMSMSVHDRRITLLNGLGEIVRVNVDDSSVVARRQVGGTGFTPRKLVGQRGDRVLVLGSAREPIRIMDWSADSVMRLDNPTSQLVQSACTLRDGRLLLATVDTGSSVLLVDSAGTLRRQSALPWPQLAEADPLQRQTWLAATPDGRRCAMALAVGRGFAVTATDASARTYDYVEPFATPAVRVITRRRRNVRRVREARLLDPAVAAEDVAANGTLLFVAFDGHAEYRGSIVDTYSLATGAYRGTYRFPFPLRGIGAGEHHLYVAGYVRGRPVVAEYPLERRADRPDGPHGR